MAVIYPQQTPNPLELMGFSKWMPLILQRMFEAQKQKVTRQDQSALAQMLQGETRGQVVGSPEGSGEFGFSGARGLTEQQATRSNLVDILSKFKGPEMRQSILDEARAKPKLYNVGRGLYTGEGREVVPRPKAKRQMIQHDPTKDLLAHNPNTGEYEVVIPADPDAKKKAARKMIQVDPSKDLGYYDEKTSKFKVIKKAKTQEGVADPRSTVAQAMFIMEQVGMDPKKKESWDEATRIIKKGGTAQMAQRLAWLKLAAQMAVDDPDFAHEIDAKKRFAFLEKLVDQFAGGKTPQGKTTKKPWDKYLEEEEEVF